MMNHRRACFCSLTILIAMLATACGATSTDVTTQELGDSGPGVGTADAAMSDAPMPMPDGGSPPLDGGSGTGGCAPAPADFTAVTGDTMVDCEETPDHVLCAAGTMNADSLTACDATPNMEPSAGPSVPDPGADPGSCLVDDDVESAEIARTAERRETLSFELKLKVWGPAGTSVGHTPMDVSSARKLIITIKAPAAGVALYTNGRINRNILVNGKSAMRFESRTTTTTGFKVGIGGFDAGYNIEAGRTTSIENAIETPEGFTIANLFPTDPNFRPTVAQVVHALNQRFNEPARVTQLRQLHATTMSAADYVFGENWATMPFGCRPGIDGANGAPNGNIVTVCDRYAVKWQRQFWNVVLWHNNGYVYSWGPDGQQAPGPDDIVMNGMNNRELVYARTRVEVKQGGGGANGPFVTRVHQSGAAIYANRTAASFYP